jgi:hypothetical protein
LERLTEDHTLLARIRVAHRRHHVHLDALHRQAPRHQRQRDARPTVALVERRDDMEGAHGKKLKN